MVTINLFPWREAEIKYQKQSVKKIFLSVLVLTAIMHLGSYVLLSKQKNALHVQLVNKQESLKKSGKMQFVSGVNNNSQNQQVILARLFKALGEKPQINACFDQIKQDKHDYYFYGRARSMQDLTAYFLHWEAAHLFSEIKIKSITQENAAVKFEVVAKGM